MGGVVSLLVVGVAVLGSTVGGMVPLLVVGMAVPGLSVPSMGVPPGGVVGVVMATVVGEQPSP